MRRWGEMLLVVAGVLGGASTAPAESWLCLSGDPARRSTAAAGPRSLEQRAWVAVAGSGEQFVARSSAAVHGGRVFVNARRFDGSTQIGNLVIAYSTATGARLWATPVERDILDSWSSPAVDARNGLVLLGSGQRLSALRVADGSIAWEPLLSRPIVNASPVVTTDMRDGSVPVNRVFISDYDGFGTDASLYAVNVDPYHGLKNPYQPGEIVWSASLPGASGASAAYADGRVYAASVSGTVRAFDARTGAPLWKAETCGTPCEDGFFGGLTVAGGAVYIASYDFYGGSNNSLLFKLDAGDGEVLWSAPCERSESIPVVLDDGRVILSGGIAGFGSAVRIQAFEDLGSAAALVWDTHVDTGGSLVLGGWTLHPVVSRGWLFAGRPGSGLFGPYEELAALDLALSPGQAGFVRTTHGGSGGSPAVGCGRMVSLGTAGLSAFAVPAACVADINESGAVGFDDLTELMASYGTTIASPGFNPAADVSCDGVVSFDDLTTVLAEFGHVCP